VQGCAEFVSRRVAFLDRIVWESYVGAFGYMRQMKSLGALIYIVLCVGAAIAWAGTADRDLSEAFKSGAQLIEPYLKLTDKGATDPTTPEARARISEGIRILTDVTKGTPDNWPAFWMIGKGHQSLGNHVAAEAAFKRAYAINPENADIARELMIESICSDHTSDAVEVAKRAVRQNAMAADLVANLALAYLADGQLVEAREAVERAAKLAPGDEITRGLLVEIKAVQGGRKAGNYCPP
jgi:tetratricopeptide (TPR) repeat protein